MAGWTGNYSFPLWGSLRCLHLVNVVTLFTQFSFTSRARPEKLFQQSPRAVGNIEMQQD